ncbi:MAG: 5-carboxymethyl-2-hydroxymuconate Delta-isomerase [Candidatus Kariarchaeaceae archaeon]|jgi:5-carboxymethyl-2-hydroxymuconate isomerase
MPQICLEYSANIPVISNYKTIFKQVHYILNTEGNIKLNNCKSRLIRHADFYIGDGSSDHAFVHLEISLLEGRSNELKEKMGKDILGFLQDAISTENILKLQITVHFKDISKNSYFKYPSGTLTPQ